MNLFHAKSFYLGGQDMLCEQYFMMYILRSDAVVIWKTSRQNMWTSKCFIISVFRAKFEAQGNPTYLNLDLHDEDWVRIINSV